MNRSKIWNRLLHDIANVNNARFHRKLSKSVFTFPSCEKKLSTNPDQNYSIKARTFVRSNKKSGFCVYENHRNFGFFHHQSFILLAQNNSHKNIRRFSDASNPNIVIPTNVQLDGFWKDLSESAAVEFCQNGFVSLHEATGLPWWATIVLATWSIRAVVTLPLALYQNYILAKVANLKFEMDGIVKDLKMETNFAVAKFKWTEDYARAIYNRSLKKQWQKLIERENCHPMKSAILLIVQIPMWIVLSTSLRNLCYMLPYSSERAYGIYLELTTGGFGWVTNLAAVDHSFALPITLGLLNLTIVEMQNLLRTTEPTKTQKYLLYFFRLAAVGMVPLASLVPAGMSLYWASSSAFGIVQNLMLMSPRVRRLARIPPTDNELEEPYKHLYKNLRYKIGLKEVSPPSAVKKL